jgi:tryptophanyl-tRNA synthetase
MSVSLILGYNTETMTKPVILTGIRANNNLTLGNYFGAMLPIIDMAKQKSDDYQVNMFIPDLHSFTTPIDHSVLHDQIFHTARVFAAAGLPLDNDNIYMYRQSYVPAHSELTWILDCFTGFGEMSRMTQFKDKTSKLGNERVTMGLFNYPVLMAADYLLYGAKYVPVGDDQTQHLEYGRDVAMRMNNQFGDIFTIPEPVKKQHEFFGNDQGLRIMDLADPSKKMSKSDDTGKGVIFLNDDPEAAMKKVMSATTDDKALVAYDPLEQPGISNLLQIHALISGQSLETVIEHHAKQNDTATLSKKLRLQSKHF